LTFPKRLDKKQKMSTIENASYSLWSRETRETVQPSHSEERNTVASKAEQIIDNFTTDAALKAEILAAIPGSKGSSDRVGYVVDKVAKHQNLSAVATAKLHQAVQTMLKTGAPANVGALHPDTTKAPSITSKVTTHQATVHGILGK
jgi:phospholipase/lecithinase/hemolysin